MIGRIRELEPADIPACAAILSDLPEWFAVSESTRSYIEGLSHLPAVVVEHEGRVIGFVSMRSHHERSAEIDVMALQREFHRSGAGQALVAWCFEWCRSNNVVWLHVKTRGPTTPDPFYERTRQFYQAVGFDPLFESLDIWGPEDAALILICKVEPLA